MSFVLLQVQSRLYRKRKTGVNFLARPQGKLHNSFYHGIWSAPKHLGLGLLLQQRQKGVCHATPSCHYYHWLTPWWALPHPLCWRRTVKCLLLSIQCVVASGTNKSEVHKSFLTQPVRHLEQSRHFGSRETMLGWKHQIANYSWTSTQHLDCMHIWLPIKVNIFHFDSLYALCFTLGATVKVPCLWYCFVRQSVGKQIFAWYNDQIYIFQVRH